MVANRLLQASRQQCFGANFCRFTLLTSAVLLGMSLLSGCGHKDAQQAQAEAREAVRVKVMAVSPSAAGAQTELSGTVSPGTETPLSFTVPGTVKSVRVNVGDRVARGALIATLDHSTLSNSYEIAKAELAQAQDAYNRLKLLHERRALAEIKWVDIQSKLRQAEAAAAIARKSLEDANLYAPFAGTVAKKLLEQGATAAPGMPVVTLLTPGELKVAVSVPQNRIGEYAVGDTAQVRFAALGDARFQARLTEKGVQADPLSRSYTVKYTILKPSAEILPGMTCTLLTAPKSSAIETPQITVPLEAVLLSDTNQNFVWLARNGQAERRDVAIGSFTPEGDRVVITSGLEPSDSVITAGIERVARGTSLEIIN